MGLDIYHFLVREDVTGTPVVIDVRQPQIQKIVAFSHKKKSQYFDFERLLVDHNFSPQDYRLAGHQRETRGIGKFSENYYFCAASDPDPMNPTKMGIYFTNKRSFFGVKPSLPPNVVKKLKTVKLKQYPTRDQVDDVVYTQQVGYQRNGVINDFFHEFKPDWMFAERSYARRIYELTVPEAQQAFRSNFLDNWDEQHSLVLISW
jgi:hypothetical protein